MVMIRILSGYGRYADPWHPFAETSAGIASVAASLDHPTEVRDVTPDALGDLAEISVLVVNTGGGGPQAKFSPDPAWSEAFAAAEGWIRAGGRLLATHTGTNGFPDWPAFRQLLGGYWQPGVSMHPPRDEARFTAEPEAHQDRLLAGLPTIDDTPTVTAVDERYSNLIMSDDAVVVLRHVLDGAPQPVVWRQRTAGLNIIVDALGHGPESYESPSRRQLLANELRELLTLDA